MSLLSLINSAQHQHPFPIDLASLPGYTGDFLRRPAKDFVYAPGHLEPTWRNLPDVEVVAITRWLDNRLPSESVNGQMRTVTFDRPSLFALVPWAVGDSVLHLQ